MEREDFFFHFFFTADILLVPSCSFGIQKKERGGVPAPSFVGGTWPGSRTKARERFLVEISGGILEPYVWAAFLKKANYNIGDVNDGL